jgi:hypothetical protein
VARLEPLYSISIVDQYAKAYGVLPRIVQQEPFDEVFPFLFLWKEQDEFRERLDQIINPPKDGPPE